MTIILPTYTGPGPQTLIGQYINPNNPSIQHGFFGEVSAAELITGDVLASAIGLTAGTSQNDTTPWLKFYIDGKIVYVPKKAIRHSVSWQDIYQAGAVYGDGTTGLNPAGKPRKQDATVNIGADTFKVMLLRGANSNPATKKEGYDPDNTHSSEWNRLFYNVVNINCNNKISQEGDQWANYTNDDLGIKIYELGAFSWCMEKFNDGNRSRVVRGHFDITVLTSKTVTADYVYYGWRPKLQLVL